MRRVIDREQVLHVARLARLRLGEEEVERCPAELSGILEHVDRIAELDLDDAEPTSHVVDLENVLRPDEPRPSWPRERMLELGARPRDGAFRVPSPQAEAEPVADLLELTVAEAAAKIAGGELLRRRVPSSLARRPRPATS